MSGFNNRPGWDTSGATGIQANGQYASDIPGSGSGPIRPSHRASAACARCRRQKLKCDSVKPCTMCVRSGMPCRPRTVPATAGRRRSERLPDGVVEGVNSGIVESLSHRRSDISSSPGIEVGSSPSSISVQTDVAATTLTRQRTEPSPDTRQFGANRSAMSLAIDMYESLGTSAPLRTSTIPGDSTPSRSRSPPWTLQLMQMPAPHIMEALIEVYFDKVDWFIWIFHKPSFVQQARRVLSATSWRREDLSKILVTLTVAALGVKCVMQDSSPRGQRLLALMPCEPRMLMDQMVNEVQLHLVSLLEDSCIETVQVCVLLGAFHIFHSSPTLAWTMIGLSVRASYALALHCDSETNQIAGQIRRRCWNHLTVADTFASQIYGRPASLDPAFSDLLPLSDIDDTAVDISAGHPIRDKYGVSVSGSSFHWFKYRLYEITRKILSTFRLMRLHNPMTVDELQSLITAVQDLDAQLHAWRESLPPPLNSDLLSADIQLPSPQDLQQDHDEGRSRNLRQLKLQAYLLQITYDAAVILAHRPLLEHKLSSSHRQDVSRSSTEYVSKSFDVSIRAALRISRVPVMEFQNEFCMAFIFVHLFSAGVILCIPPTSHPHSATAQEAKAGVFRIIQAARALRSESHIARHTERLLSDLLKLSLHREVDLAFKEDRQVGMTMAAQQQEQHQPSSQQEQNERRPMASGNNNLSGPPDNPPTDSCGDETLLPNNLGLHTDRTTLPRDADIADGNMNEDWGLPPSFQNLMSTDTYDMQHMDLPLDEAFGAFGQVMFNLMPDDPLNIWGWGKGSM